MPSLFATTTKSAPTERRIASAMGWMVLDGSASFIASTMSGVAATAYAIARARCLYWSSICEDTSAYEARAPMITVAATIATCRRSSCDGTARSGGRTRCERMCLGPSLLRRILHARDRVDHRVHEHAARRAHLADV